MKIDPRVKIPYDTDTKIGLGTSTFLVALAALNISY
jgi:hypothetical protein